MFQRGIHRAELIHRPARPATPPGRFGHRAHLLDWNDYDAFNAAYAAWFSDRVPSRTCVGVTGLAVGAIVEIDWVCWRNDGWGATIGS